MLHVWSVIICGLESSVPLSERSHGACQAPNSMACCKAWHVIGRQAPLNSFKRTPKVDAPMTRVEGYLACRSHITSNTCVCVCVRLGVFQLHCFEPARFHPFKFHPIPLGSAFLHASSLVSTARIRTLSPAAAAIITSKYLQIMNSKLLQEVCQATERKRARLMHAKSQSKTNPLFNASI